MLIRNEGHVKSATGGVSVVRACLRRTALALAPAFALLAFAGGASAQMGMPGGMGPPDPDAGKSADAELLPEVRKDIADDPRKVYERAEKAFERKDWPTAIAHYQHLRDRFPYELEMASTSELRLGDIAFQRERWAEARVLYRNFVRFRPAHGSVDYATFRAGLAAFKEVPGETFLHPPAVERDQAEAREALELLRHFVGSFPRSEYVKEASEAIAECENFLAAHELYVAKYYDSRKKWRGVLLRVDTLRRIYPESKHFPEALVLAVRAHLQLGEPDDARRVFAELQKKDDAAKHVQRAKALLPKES